MAKPLSYPNLKYVLEYLEASKRIHITARCPSLRKLKQIIPLHLDQLSLGSAKIALNDITFKLFGSIQEDFTYVLNDHGGYDRVADNVLFPGDIPLEPDLRQTDLSVYNQKNIRQYHYMYLSFRKDLRQHVPKTQVPHHLKFQVAMKHITNCLLGSRPEIIVKHLKIVDDEKLKILRLPVDLNLKVQELQCSSNHIKYLIPIITDLKMLILHQCYWDDDPCFDIPIVQNVPKLTINGLNGPYFWRNTLVKLSNREVILKINSFSKDALIHVLQMLLETEKKIGTYYRIEFQSWPSTVLNIEDELKQRFRATVTDELRDDSFSFTIPRNSTSELTVCGTCCADLSYIEIKVAPKPKLFSWNNVLKYLEGNRRLCLTTLCPNLCGIESTLHLGYLSLGYSSITLNDITYQLYTLKDNQQHPYALDQHGVKDLSADNVQMSGDIRMDSQNVSSQTERQTHDQKKYPVRIGFKKYDSVKIIYSKEIPNNLEFHVAMRLLTSYLLGGRPEIQVKKLEIQAHLGDILRLPLGLKLQVQELIAEQNVIEFVLPIIDEGSFPLKKLKMVKALPNHPAFQLRIVQDAQNLKILESGLGVHEVKHPSPWEQTLLQLPNEQVYLKCDSLKTTSLMNYIQNLMDTGRDNGTIHTIDWALTKRWTTMLHEIEKKYNRKARIQQVDSDRCSTSLPVTTFSISLSMSSTSEFVISGTANHKHCAIKMGVVPFGQDNPAVVPESQEILPNPVDHNTTNFFATFFSRFLSCVRPHSRNEVHL